MWKTIGRKDFSNNTVQQTTTLVEMPYNTLQATGRICMEKWLEGYLSREMKYALRQMRYVISHEVYVISHEAYVSCEMTHTLHEMTCV
ncbi:hypothetical protein [Sphingobacterium olei]|uniref:hypothetical protein n=1 Tax=Sphingobacterium olei TaxID=2571155 RepID=UPI0010ADF315|nr:hypothetical protein [Sphingobacterium olei]